MIVFEIRNEAAGRRLLGYLTFYERSRRFFAELLRDLDEWSAPFMFIGHVKRNIYSIDSVWSGKFVAQRIIPPDRQNLGSILKENGLKSYDELKLLMLCEGRCAQDDLCLVRIQEKDILPDIQKRMHEKVLDVMALRDYKALVFFRDGMSRMIDIKKLCADNRLFGNILRSEEVFRNIRVSPGGNGIEWGEERFLAAEMLRQSGKTADVTYDDLLGFVRTRLTDTAETAKILNCSRQYVKQLGDQERLLPLREGGNSCIYVKSEIEAERF